MSAPKAMFTASVDMMPALPGGYEFAVGDDVVTARTAAEIMPKVRRLLLKHGISAPAEMALAEYMCPRMGPFATKFCTGVPVPPEHVLAGEALKNSASYMRRPMVPFETIQRRMGMCSDCPAHERHWCPTCVGALSKLKDMSGGRRPTLPVDRFSGVCGCARAYEAAVCSVDYEEGEAVWSGTPETCWRRKGDV